HYQGDLPEATREAYRQLEGHFAFVVIHHDHPEELVGARHQCPLLVGVGAGEMFFASMAAAFLCEARPSPRLGGGGAGWIFFASSAPAFIGETRSIQLIEDGEVVAITPAGSRFVSVEDGELEREVVEVDWDMDAAEK